jgi:hypothetical protein
MWLISNYINANIFNFRKTKRNVKEKKKVEEESVQSCFGAKRRFGAASCVQVDNGVIKVLPKQPVKSKRSAPKKKTREKKTDYAQKREKNFLRRMKMLRTS